jgi:hypothetical protein
LLAKELRLGVLRVPHITKSKRRSVAADIAEKLAISSNAAPAYTEDRALSDEQWGPDIARFYMLTQPHLPGLSYS